MWVARLGIGSSFIRALVTLVAGIIARPELAYLLTFVVYLPNSNRCVSFSGHAFGFEEGEPGGTHKLGAARLAVEGLQLHRPVAVRSSLAEGTPG